MYGTSVKGLRTHLMVLGYDLDTAEKQIAHRGLSQAVFELDHLRKKAQVLEGICTDFYNLMGRLCKTSPCTSECIYHPICTRVKEAVERD